MSDAHPEPELEPSEQRARRRFTLLDMILLVAAVAVGQRGYMAVLAIYASTGVGAPWQVISSIRRIGLLRVPYHVLFWFEIAAPLLLALMTSLFASRRLRPRPTGLELARQPGAVAISSAFLGAAAVFAAWGLVGYPLLRAGKLVAGGPMTKSSYPFLLTIMLASMVASGASTAAGWVNIAINGFSLRDADWVEWAGRVLGFLLVLATPFYLWATLLYH